MNKIACQGLSCTNAAIIYVVRVENRVLLTEKWFCQNHINNYLGDILRRHFSGGCVGRAISHGPNRVIPVDLNLILFDQSRLYERAPCLIYLAEIGGARRLAVPTGYFETSNLQWELTGDAFRRPPTHRMVSDLARLTGGRLENAVIDRYHEHEQIYEAKLHFAYGGGSVELDVRPSDAFAVAAACRAPILVSNDILEKMEVKRG